MNAFSPQGRALLAVATALTLAACGPKIAAPAPGAKIVGPRETVFDASADACDALDYPDLPARAIRDRTGAVHVYIAHMVNRRLTGPDFDHLEHPCAPALRSGDDPRPARYDGLEWIAAPYTTDGHVVHALVHNEFQGQRQPPDVCPSRVYRSCWYNAVTLARSDDGGRTFTHKPPPEHFVAGVPYRYVPDIGHVGVFTPSNIVRDERDGFLYSLVQVQEHRAQARGACVMRTRTPERADSWRAWDGDGFDLQFANPYVTPGLRPQRKVCAPVSTDEIQDMTQSLTWNTYFDRWLLVGRAGRFDRRKGSVVWGFYFSLSDDLVEWTDRTLLMQAELPWTYRCGDRPPVNYPSVIDPSSRSRTYATSDRRIHLYFTRFNQSGCTQTADRDLVRVPVEFSR